MMTKELVLFHLFGFPISLFWTFFIFMWIIYIWETYLDFRQRSTVRGTSELPPALKNLINDDEFQKSKSYSLDKSAFSFIHGLYNMVESSFVLYFSVIPWLWLRTTSDAVRLNDFLLSYTGIDFGFNADSEIRCSLLFLLYASIFNFVISLPWSLYYNFVIEARYGFNNQTLAFYFKDRFKSLAISIAIGFPIASGLIWIVKAGGQWFYIYAYLFSLVVTLFLMYVYPEFIAPLFDRYEPLPQSALREKIEALAARIEFPLKKLLVVEGSKRSAHSNAYFYGFGNNKRIVLFDTLIRDFKFPGKEESEPPAADTTEENTKPPRGCAVDEEVVAVLGHELGHWKCWHTIFNLVFGQMNLLLMFTVFSPLMNIQSLFASFGFTSYVPILLRFVVIFQFIFSPYNHAVSFLLTAVSRRFEFQADRFAVSLDYGKHLKSALMVLHKDNLSFPVSDWLYSMYNYSHPPLLERLAAIDVSLSKNE